MKDSAVPKGTRRSPAHRAKIHRKKSGRVIGSQIVLIPSYVGSSPLGDEHSSVPARPFIKWAGGKSQIVPELVRRLPRTFNRYIEPFMGGAALFFAVRPQRATLGDINGELVNAYTVVRDNEEKLIKHLRGHIHSSQYFYALRNSDRSVHFRRWSGIRRASRLIYLNKTCYNGLYRVNSRGEFNVPFGRYVNPLIVDPNNLRACSRVLKGVEIVHGNFDEVAKKAKKNDFVYFDPPFFPLSVTSNFTSYTKHGFGEDQQRALFELCRTLDKKGVRFMLSNSSAPFILDLYKPFQIEKIPVSRAINSKGSGRGKVDEVIVRNY